MKRGVRPALAITALAAFATVGVVSIRETRDQLAVIEACDALRKGDFLRTLELTRGRTGRGSTGHAAVECRCRALIAQGEEAPCRELLRDLASDPAWFPAPDLLDLAIDARAALEPELTLLEDLALRLPEHGDVAARGRALLAQRHLRRGDPEAALRVLGAKPPEGTRDGLSLWYDTRLHAHAQGGDARAARRTRAAWLGSDADPAEVRARYALALSIAGLADPDADPIRLLQRSLEETAATGDLRLREGLAIRLVLTLTDAGRMDEALAVFDRHRTELGLEGLRRGELLRAARRERLAGAPAAARRGTLRFFTGLWPEGSELRVSPDEGAPVDTPFEWLAVPASGEVTASRSEGEAPQRWVLRRANGVVASGTVNPRAGSERNVWIIPGGVATPLPSHLRSRARADGRPRVVLVLLDSGDWRILSYLRARGELPVLTSLLRDGYRAVLHSDPPLTAAALESLVWPERHSGTSLLGWVHRMGVELAGLESVGDNPFAALRFVLPESDDLFSRVGANGRSAANLLLAHGGIRAGRHGEVSGPRGRRSRVPIGRATRDLEPDERARWPDLADPPTQRDRHYVRTMAAELDATEELARSGEHDLVAVRIEPLDILTHSSYAETTIDAQDDGRGLLFSVYRYIDARLGDVDAALDEDDVLIVMSDHGVRTAMEHSRDAIFVAVGGGLPAGRAEGRPDLRGVPRAVADLLGVPTHWPDTGVTPPRLAEVATAGESSEARPQ